MAANKTPAPPEPDKESTVEDWFAQSVERDNELAEQPSEQLTPKEAERARAAGEGRSSGEQQAGRGWRIHPEQCQSACLHKAG
jgi:hypothetical protein